MWVQQILTVLLIHFSVYQTTQSSPYVRTNTVSITFSSKDTNLINCQHCLLSLGGATRVKLVRDSIIKESKFTALEFEVTALEFGFVIIEQICRIRSICGKLTVHRSEDKSDQSIILPRELPRSIVCLAVQSTTARCRDCLKEASDSAYLGNFRATSTLLRTSFALNILFTSKKAEYIVDSCIVSRACTEPIVELQGKVCGFLIPANIMPDVTWEETTSDLLWARSTSARGIMNLQQHFSSGPLKHLCLEFLKEGEDMQKEIRCMSELAGMINGLAVMLHKGLKKKHIHVIGLQDDSFPADYIAIRGKKMRKVNQNICNKLNAHQFDTSSISNQISVFKSQEAQMERANVKIEYISECVWTRHDPAISKCTSCLRALGILAKSVLPLSQSTSLTRLVSKFEKATLASCINIYGKRPTLQCEQFVFVPDFMCEYDLKQPEQTSSPQEQQQGTRYPVAFDTVGSSSNPRNFSSGYLASSISHQQSLQLFGKQLKLEPPVTMVSFKAPKASDCAASLALKYTVLMISIKKQYVWMLYDHVEPLSAEGCTNLHMCHRLQHDVHMLRAVSAEDVIRKF